MEAVDTKNYEVSFLSKTEGAAGDVMKLLRQHGAEVLEEGTLKKIGLAYAIEKETQAYFGFVYVKLPPQAVKSLEQDLRRSTFVLRFLIITLPAVATSSEAPRPRPQPVRLVTEARAPAPLSNEAIERKIEEILK